jgi:hypothetical protein
MVRLVAASMKITIQQTGTTGLATGYLSGASYTATNNPASLSTNDLGMANLSQLMKIPNARRVDSNNDGLKIIYVPVDISSNNWIPYNSVIGQGGTNTISTMRMVAIVSNTASSVFCIGVECTQILEVNPYTTATPDWFCPYSNYLHWYPGELITKYITGCNKEVILRSEELSIYNGFLEEIRKNDEIEKESNCKCIQKRKLTKQFFFPEKIQKMRLPSMFGERTCLMKQRHEIFLNTSNNGAFALQWFPQIYNTTGANTLTGFYYMGNGTSYDGFNNPGTATNGPDIDFPLQGFANATTIQPWIAVRLVAASIKVMYAGENVVRSGEFIGAINYEQPTIGTTATTIPVTNYTYSQLINMSSFKKVPVFDGLKIISVPFDYSCFEFIPINFLGTGNTILPNIMQSFYLIGYGLPNSSGCVKLIIDRVFEGKVNNAITPAYTNISQMFVPATSTMSYEKCNEMTNHIIENNMQISSLLDEPKLMKTLFK